MAQMLAKRPRKYHGHFKTHHIQVIGRLIQQQNVRVFHCQHREHDTAWLIQYVSLLLTIQEHQSFHSPVPETVGKLTDRTSLMCASNTESTNLLTPELDVLLREFALERRLEVLNG